MNKRNHLARMHSTLLIQSHTPPPQEGQVKINTSPPTKTKPETKKTKPATKKTKHKHAPMKDPIISTSSSRTLVLPLTPARPSMFLLLLLLFFIFINQLKRACNLYASK